MSGQRWVLRAGRRQQPRARAPGPDGLPARRADCARYPFLQLGRNFTDYARYAAALDEAWCGVVRARLWAGGAGSWEAALRSWCACLPARPRRGFLVRDNIAPVWVGEFGVEHTPQGVGSPWFQAATRCGRRAGRVRACSQGPDGAPRILPLAGVHV